MTKASIARSILAAFALAWCALAHPAFAQTREPEAIVSSFYKAAKSDGGNGPAFGFKPQDRKLLSKSLAALWAKADRHVKARGDKVGAISFDIATQSQGVDIASYKVKSERKDASSAVIEATFIIGGNHARKGDDVVVLYDFVRENGSWKIDNLRTESKVKSWSLRGNLATKLKT
jgi:hypothetical protein